MSTRKNALGKGLSALLTSRPVSVLTARENTEHTPAQTHPSDTPPDGRSVRLIPLGQIRPNPRQPRHVFNPEALEELRDSILSHGVLQPVLVTQDRSIPGSFILVAGERRLRAAEMARLPEIPALISDVTDEEMLEIAIVENVQRDDLNPVEEARAYRSLIDSFGWSQEQIASRVGKKRSTVANALRLLRLGDDALKDLEEGRLTAGHARAILSIDDGFYRQKLRQEVVGKGISVREAERRAIAYQKAGAPTGKGAKKENAAAPERLDIVALAEQLMGHLGCRVRIFSRDGKSGKLEIPFQNPEELERFLQAINFEVT